MGESGVNKLILTGVAFEGNSALTNKGNDIYNDNSYGVKIRGCEPQFMRDMGPSKGYRWEPNQGDEIDAYGPIEMENLYDDGSRRHDTATSYECETSTGLTFWEIIVASFLIFSSCMLCFLRWAEKRKQKMGEEQSRNGQVRGRGRDEFNGLEMQTNTQMQIRGHTFLGGNSLHNHDGLESTIAVVEGVIIVDENGCSDGNNNGFAFENGGDRDLPPVAVTVRETQSEIVL